MGRDEIYVAIDSERQYQDKRWSNFDDKNNHPADWVLYIENHISKAKTALYNSHDMKVFNDEMRKIAALVVACGEIHGMSNR